MIVKTGGHALAFVLEADGPCPSCEYVTTWYATPDQRPTVDHCAKCGVKVYATVNVEGETIEVVEA